MRGFKRQGSGWTVAVVACLSVAPSIGLGSAMGPAPWTKLELSSPTNLGVFHIRATTTISEDGIRLDRLDIDLDGKPLPWPKSVDLRVMHPQLHKLQVVSTRTYTCFDECPDISAWPVWLQFSFGENPANSGDDECEYPMIMFEFSPQGIESIKKLTCAKGENRERVLYSRAGAGE